MSYCLHCHHTGGVSRSKSSQWRTIHFSFVLAMGFSTSVVADEELPFSEHEFAGKVSLVASVSDAITGQDAASMSRLEGDDSFDLKGQVALSYEFTQHQQDSNWGLFSHLQLSNEGHGDSTEAGVVELYGYYEWALGANSSVTSTVGQMFMPSSLENSEAFWDSPYNNNFSALNTWIAEEIRPIGVSFQYDWFADEDAVDFSAFGVGGGLFMGNDSTTSQSTWRGFSIGRHKTLYAQVLPLPELEQLNDGIFTVHRKDGSKPFGRDLDSRYGFWLNGYWQMSNDVTFTLSFWDNNGDGQLHRGEYAWDTQFVIAGAKWQFNDNWLLLIETMHGTTGMGQPAVMGVGVNFQTSYALLNYEINQWNMSVRLEQFDAVDRARFPQESNDGGKALTLAARWQAFGQPWSVISELLFIDVDGSRDRQLNNGLFSDEDESQLSLSLSYFF